MPRSLEDFIQQLVLDDGPGAPVFRPISLAMPSHSVLALEDGPVIGPYVYMQYEAGQIIVVFQGEIPDDANFYVNIPGNVISLVLTKTSFTLEPGTANTYYWTQDIRIRLLPSATEHIVTVMDDLDHVLLSANLIVLPIGVTLASLQRS